MVLDLFPCLGGAYPLPEPGLLYVYLYNVFIHFLNFFLFLFACLFFVSEANQTVSYDILNALLFQF